MRALITNIQHFYRGQSAGPQFSVIPVTFLGIMVDGPTIPGNREYWNSQKRTGRCCWRLSSCLVVPITGLQILHSWWRQSFPLQDNSSLATCELMLTGHGSLRMSHREGVIYQETKLTCHNLVPLDGSLSFWIKAILCPPLLFLLDGGCTKKQWLVSICPGANY